MTLKEFVQIASGIDEYDVYNNSTLLICLNRYDMHNLVLFEDILCKRIVHVDFKLTRFQNLICVVEVEG